MKNMWRRSVIASGVFVTIASTARVGCAGPKRPMSAWNLETFRADCVNKEVQVKWLQSQRTSRDDRLLTWMQTSLEPWKVFTDNAEYQRRGQVVSGYNDWLLNQSLQTLDKDCP